MHISILAENTILHILQYLESKDRIALAYTCKRFRQICIDATALMKVDFSSRCVISQQGEIIMKDFCRDKDMLQHIRELNLNNQRVFGSQMVAVMAEFIMAICPQLEALHILYSGMSLMGLQYILQKAHRLTSLSWSMMELTEDDIEFLVVAIESSYHISLENIKNLHLEILECSGHVEILQYLVLNCCKFLEDLKIYMWHGYCPEAEGDIDWDDISLPQSSSSVTNELQHLHSFTMHAVCDQSCSCTLESYDTEPGLSEFIVSLVRKKSPETKWKKFWVSAPVDISILEDNFDMTALAVPLSEDCPDAFCTIQALAGHVQEWELDEPGMLFEMINDNALQNLQLCALDYHQESNLIFELCEHIQRTGGSNLKNLSLCINSQHLKNVPASLAFSMLFSTCSNIRELDLLGCHFNENICGPLSTLKHLVKVQVRHCAIFSKDYGNQLEETNVNLLTFVQNCQKIMDFDIRSCSSYVNMFSCCLFDEDQMALAELTKLRSLTVYKIYDIRQCAFLKSIIENCKFLTMLRISVKTCDSVSYFTVLQSAKFLKHLAIDVSVDLGLEDFWELLSGVTKLERLCIKSDYMGSLNVSCAVEMLKRLPLLHVLHVHCEEIENFEIFRDQIVRTVEEETSDHVFCFEFLMEEFNLIDESRYWIYNELHPPNRLELCDMSPRLTMPTF